MVWILAPIKRPLSIKNTCPSQKEYSIFAESPTSAEATLFVYLRPAFQVLGMHFELICSQAPIRFQVNERKNCFLFDPWSV